MTDQTRQMVTRIEDVRPDHRERYAFAAKLCEGTVLDAACGVGYGSKMLMDAGCRVIGMDVEPAAIDHALQYFPGPEYMVANVETAELPGVDWVVSFETVEHLRNPEHFLRAARGAARQLIVSTPNEERYRFDPFKFAGDDYPHLRHYTPDEFDTLLESCGWEIVERCCQVSKIAGVTNGTDGLFLVYVCR